MSTTIETIIHNWATNPAYEKRLTSLNVFAENGTIYSYGHHFPMGKWFANKKGERCVLFTKETYSITTSRHLSITRYAIPSNVPVFHVSELDNFLGEGYRPGLKAIFKRAFQAYIDEATALFVKASRSRTHGACHIKRAKELLRDAKAFSAFFRLGLRTPDGAKPKVIAKIISDQKERAKKAREAAKKKEEWKRAYDKTAFSAWQRGASNSCPASYREDEDGSAYLRTVRNDEGEQEVQTSQGASVPLAHAVRAFAFIKLCRMTGQGFEANGKTVRVGNFTVRTIEANGNTTIGCHFLTWERLEEWARTAGILDEPASPLALESVAENVL